MTGLVPGHQALLVIIHDAAAFAAPQDLVARLVDVRHLDLLFVAPGREQRRLVEQIGQLGTGQAGRALSIREDMT